MGEVLKTWLRDRLGLIIDLSPESFGVTTRDGTLLAQLLHSYDIIDNAQLKTIITTEDPALARVNLKHLRIWLKFIGVDCSDDTIEDISNGRGTTATRLFYKIFVSLESKDKLHFITQQKEREKFIPNSSKFDVTTVSEKPPTPEPSENPLAEQLSKNASIISWHRSKFQAILDRCKTARRRCVTMQKQRKDVQAEVEARIDHEKHKVQTDGVESSIEKDMQDLRDFSKKHEVRCGDGYTYHELCKEKKFGKKIDPTPVDPEAAKAYVKCMKDRTRRTMETFSCKSKMEKELTAKLWDKQKQDQENEFDEAIAKKLFSQSQYEKQMMTKLCEIRDQKRRIARNRGLVDKIMQERMRTEHSSELAREHEVIVKQGEDIQAECLRLCELHRRIREEKIRNSERKRYRMCEEVLDDLIDISLRAVNYRESNDNWIPSKIWAEWKALFVKSQPIFDPVEHIERITEYMSEEEVEEIERVEIERQSILNDDDFENYLNLGPPWDEFIPEIDLESEEVLRLGIIVLGYIVHRLLQYLNPLESEPEPASVPKVSSACILLGVLDVTVYPIMQTLLKHRGVRLIRMEDAINHCLSCYKKEMKSSAYIDLEKLSSKKEAQQKIVPSGQTSRTKKDAVKKQETPVKTPKNTTTTTKLGIDEETQTPHALPNEDMSPDLSNPAYIGKWTHEFLTLGQPIPNELNTKILIEYLKSLTDVKGWVLVDYPNTFDQMARLEMALTGHKIPLDNQSPDDLDGDIDEIDPALSRISFEGENDNESTVFRESRLVCNPIPKPVEKSFNSYMTAYIRALPKPKNMLVDETDIYEILTEDSTPMDAFYTDHGLAYAVYYTSFNTFTLKRICRLVIGDLSVPRVPSEQLFGDGLDELKSKEQPRPSKTSIIKQLVPRPDTAKIDWSGESEYEGELNDILGVVDAEPVPPKPGEDGWEWIKFPQAPVLLEALATLWKNMETVYIEDLKEIFFVKRFHYSTIFPYRNFVMKHMEEFIQRPDVKQEMLYTFHTSYNEIEKDLRDDLDVRCELHCRVADFRKELWEVCDERRNQAEIERQRIISQDWTAEEMVMLVNLYISIIKAELDRCIDTIQLLQDYYTSMLQRPIAANRLPKYHLQRLELSPNEFEKSTSTLSPTKVNKPSNKGNKNLTNKGPHAPPTIDCSHVKKQIADLLIVSEREPLRLEELICYEAVHTNITYVQNIVESLASSVLDSLKKEQAYFTSDAKGRVQTTKSQLLPTANVEVMTDLLKRGSQLCQEWRAAVQFETSRTYLRLKLLDNAALSDVSFLYETMEHCFHNMLKSINDRYAREIKSVDDMASVFCLAIEEGIPIQEELLLDGDRFVVRTNVLMYPDPSLTSAKSEPIREAILPSQFRMGQLGRLMDVFRYVAPHGSLPERCFTYILEDMVSCGDVEGGMANLPSSWSGLRVSDVEKLVLEIFGDSEYVDWREFIIYAMDIPMPSEDEILNARSQFRAMDQNLTEMVTRDEFHQISLWFSNCSNSIHPSCKNLLHEEWQTDEEEMFDDQERRHSESENTSGLVLPYTPPNPQPSVSSQKSLTNSTFSLNSRNMTPQETVRLMLAKELLCDMFASGCDTVNYTAFLLAFSKSHDPREGLGKALTLALGEKVCVSEEEGEKFVSQLLEQQRIRKGQREDAERTASNAINDILETTLQLTEGITISDIDAVTQCGKSSGTIVDEPEQHISMHNLDPGSSRSSVTYQPDSSPRRSRSKGSESHETLLAEGHSKQSLGVIGKGVIAHWIPRDVCQSVLVASLPWHARQPDILGTTSCLRECLGKVYADIFDPEISEDEGYALSHRLVNHEFIINLINSTTVFTMKNIGNIVQSLLIKNSDSKQTFNC